MVSFVASVCNVPFWFRHWVALVSFACSSSVESVGYKEPRRHVQQTCVVLCFAIKAAGLLVLLLQVHLGRCVFEDALNLQPVPSATGGEISHIFTGA